MTRAFHVDDGLDALVQSVLDGTADEATRSSLETRMAESEELRTHFERMRATFEALGALETVEPPSEIRRTVMQKIVSEQEQVVAAENRRPRRRTPRPVGSREALAFLAGAAAVALVAISIPGILSRTGPDVGESVGSIGVSGPAEIVDQWSWSEPWGRGEALLQTSNTAASLRVRLTGEEPSTLSVSFDATRWHFAGLTTEGSMTFTRSPEPGRLELGGDGAGAVEIALRPIGPSNVSPWVDVQVEAPAGSAGRSLAATRSGESDSRANFRD